MNRSLFHLNEIPDDLIAALDRRDVSLWIQDLPSDGATQASLISFLGLPWRSIICESYDSTVFASIENANEVNDPMVRKRGFVQLIDTNPADIALQPRCLPIYLLNGRRTGTAAPDFKSQLRKLNMLEAVQRSAVRNILVISGNSDTLSQDLVLLWSTGFRSHLTFASEIATAEDLFRRWQETASDNSTPSLLSLPFETVIGNILDKYNHTYPEDRTIVRVRDRHGRYHAIDVTSADEPERPILDNYYLIRERDLTTVMPEDLTKEEVIEFFQNSEASWRPYAAGLPWVRDNRPLNTVLSRLKKLNTVGPEENGIGYIASESGAGGTTLARTLAWQCALDGYPVLVARSVPFVPNPLPLVNYIKRVHDKVEFDLNRSQDTRATEPVLETGAARDTGLSRYETPWIIVFDQVHWEYKDDENFSDFATNYRSRAAQFTFWS